MLIGLHGRKRAGKDTVFERAAHVLDGLMPVERVGFSDLLYLSAAASLGVTVRELREWKDDPGVLLAMGSRYEDGSFGVGHELTIREYLQRYGDEAHRGVFGPAFWVHRLDLAHRGRLLMVADVRYANEARAIHEARGVVVRVIGPPEVEEAGDGHASEAPLGLDLIDFTVRNDVRDDGFHSLDAQVGRVLRELLP